MTFAGDRRRITQLLAAYPPSVVDLVVEKSDRVEQRARALPARTVVYYVLALTMFPDVSYEGVMSRLTDGMDLASGKPTPTQVPSKAALAKARQRLGVEPLSALFGMAPAVVDPPLSTPAEFRGRQVVCLDEIAFEVPSSPGNVAAFGQGQPDPGGVPPAVPMVRMAGLIEQGTHLPLDVEIGPAGVDRAQMSALCRSLSPCSLLVGDRNLSGFALWVQAAATGAELVWRVRSTVVLPAEEHLDDGTYLSTLYPHRDRSRSEGGVTVRVVDRPDGPDGAGPRLITTLLDPSSASPEELRSLYSETSTWGHALAGLGGEPGQGTPTLRSRLPEGVLQEIFGLLCVARAMRVGAVGGRAVTDAVRSDLGVCGEGLSQAAK